MTRERVVYELENSIKLGISISREAREWLLDYLEQASILDKIRAEIGKSKTEHEMQLAENDLNGKLLVSHIYCGIVSILDKYKAESEEK